jgi:hypothetical protein
MPSLRTWGGRSRFSYQGSIETGTDIRYGKGWNVRVEAHQYAAIRRQFINREVPAGTSRTDPPPGSLGAWLQANVTRTAIASYVAPILVEENCAERIRKHYIRVTR